MVEVGELSVRQQPAGGDVAAAVKQIGGVSPRGRSQIVLLLHGYANSQSQASDSYDKCIANLMGLGSLLPSPMFKFYWPGDVNVPVINQLSYPWQIEDAVYSGAVLAAFLRDLSGPGGTPIQIHIIAHSLGNRVVLELLKHFIDGSTNSAVFTSLSLMAAAVPVRKVEDPSDLLIAALLPRRTQVLCSRSDMVLAIAFRAGETAAGEGFFPEAVGRNGNPSGVWSAREFRSGYGHGAYWPTDKTAPLLAKFFGAPVQSAIAENAIPAHEMPEPTVFTSNQLRERNLSRRSIIGSR
jgi:hypothetical protein